MDRSRAPVANEIALVAAFVEGKVIINISDVESYGSEHQLIGDSTDEDNNNNEGVIHGVEMPSALESRALEVDAPSTISTSFNVYSRNRQILQCCGEGMASKCDCSKRKLGWWVACEERKWRKAQERVLVALQL